MASLRRSAKRQRARQGPVQPLPKPDLCVGCGEWLDLNQHGLCKACWEDERYGLRLFAAAADA